MSVTEAYPPMTVPTTPFPVYWASAAMRVGQLPTALAVWSAASSQRRTTNLRMKDGFFDPWLTDHATITASLDRMRSAGLLSWRFERKSGFFVITPFFRNVKHA